ncbi:MAG: aspartate aminotransferase family protein [Bacteroidales bacterium]|jgi:acetylornithine/succinyldiaminopimelate/putrescine aminotransferase|nr:aspartate aminotransferase family protein [Bacteroidales bacterium]MDD4178164.1 aspartate aminotransferase family protein [Bacteroidales bacterium]MDY0335331.1 aspartate aminotransferase family protein [Bacteroidales bacterium]NCU35549.1 aspartate aminotransferase family protein [Candidatus Falkowbacteria bacterium]
MLTQRQLFFEHVALPSLFPMGLEIVSAEGIYMYGTDGTRYTDLVSGVCVTNLGHRHPAIVQAVKEQVDKYMHLMVYGEFIQSPQVKLAQLLTQMLPPSLNSVYFVNSGSEAVEGALKLAKRITGRSRLIGYTNSYHGGTHGAYSMLGNEQLKNAYRPLLPDIEFLRFNNYDDLRRIDSKTACVLAEPVQAEAGIIVPDVEYMVALRQRCTETGTLLVFDEIQTGFGRTGKLFCFEHYGITPDVICMAKGMGGGMPIGAFVADKKLMLAFTSNPDFGHITTFGGHPVCAAAALANLQVLTENPELIAEADEKGAQFEQALSPHPAVVKVRRKGLLMSIELNSIETNARAMKLLLDEGLITDPFFFMPQAFRIAPPLTITRQQISESIGKIMQVLDKA